MLLMFAYMYFRVLIFLVQACIPRTIWVVSFNNFLCETFIFCCFYQADENLRLIRASLPEAVEACIDAAGHEFDVSRQRTLLRAASYGQAFCR